MIVVGHASNVTGVVQDLRRWKDLACHCRVPLLVDASQTLGYLPIDMQAHGIDILAAAGHKGLQALPGTGLLVLAPALHSKLKPLLTGGTGQSSELLEGGNGWPNSVEVGCANLPGIVSMAVAADLLLDVRDRLTDSASTSWKASLDRLTEGLLKIPSVNLIGYSEAASGPRIPVVSVTVDGWDVHDLAAILDESFGIEVRSGLHCAALVHQAIGTDPSGTLRISLGHHTLASDIDRLLVALNQITTGGQA
jgi:selenocysteine lyase/cysteine desulfurase